MAVFPYSEQKIDLSKEEFRSLIQAAVDVMYLKGFRYLGDPRDFDHGHIMFSDQPSLTPGGSTVVMILYHTQEDAFYYNRDNPGSQFDYINPWARNWVQWRKNKKVENANKFLLEKLDPANYKINHYTTHEAMLDQKRLGVKLFTGNSKMFVFSDVSDKNIPVECRGDLSNLIVINLPTGEYKTLALMGNDYFWPYYNNYWKKEHNIK
jgi:hypothetical protein